MKIKNLLALEKQIKELKDYKTAVKKELVFRLGKLSYEAYIKSDFLNIETRISELVKKYGFDKKSKPKKRW